MAADGFGAMRDLRITDDVGKMYELGRFDREFALYGFACLDRGKSHYIISARPEKIADLVQKCLRHGRHPSAIKELHENRQVPSGTREAIAQNLKLQLARALRQAYPEAFLMLLEDYDQVVRTNEAAPLLQRLRTEVEGVFDQTQLALFEGLLVKAYSSALLDKETYLELAAWLARERADMEDDVVVRDVLEQTFYGIAYEKEAGRWVYQINAHREVLCKRCFEMEQKGKLVTPLWSEVCGYNYEYKLTAARKDFAQALSGVYDDVYLETLRHLRQRSQKEAQAADLLEKMAQIYAAFGQEAAELWRFYGCHWAILESH